MLLYVPSWACLACILNEQNKTLIGGYTLHALCRFTKSVIKSQAALTYAEAQSRIDDERLHDTLSTSLRTMNRIAKILRKQRTERYVAEVAYLWSKACF